MDKLRPYQQIGVKFLKDRKYALLGDEPGLGKTAQVIKAIPYVDAHILVICPAAVKYHWQAQFHLWGGRPSCVVDSRPLTWGYKTVIINYDRVIKPEVLKMLMSVHWEVIICDEAHRLKNPKAKRTQAILDHLFKKTTRMWFLTGTPVKNRPVDLYPILARCAPDVIEPYNTYIRFAYRYCGAYMGVFGLVTTGATRMDELGEKIKPFMLRRLQTDVLTELPERIIHKIELEHTKEVEDILENVEKEALDKTSPDSPFTSLGIDARARQELGLYKVKEANIFIQDRLEEVEKLVVFFHHHSVMHELNKKLAQFNPISISGKDSPAIRQQKVKTFVTDPTIRVLLGQMQACGEGVDGLQHICHTCIFIEPSWSPTEIDQCIHRLERMGQKEVVNAYILTIKDTIESQMMETVEWKSKVYRKLYQATEQENKIKEPDMHIEERLEKIEQNILNLATLVQSLLPQKDHPKDETPEVKGSNMAKAVARIQEKVAQKAASKPATKAKVTPEVEDIEASEDPRDATSAEIRNFTEEECRALINRLPTVYKDPAKARAKAVEVIQAHGINKLFEATQVQRNAIYATLEAALNTKAEPLNDL